MEVRCYSRVYARSAPNFRAFGLPDHDYWLFDSRKIARLHFDEGDDHLLGVEIIEDPVAVVQHNYWRDAARHWAVRRDDFAIE